MKNKNIILLFNFIWTLIIYICWVSSTETMSGGICNYWRCSNGIVMLVPVLLLIQFIINVMMFVVFNEFLNGEENEEGKEKERR